MAFSKYINFRSVLVHPPKKRKKCKRKQDVICSVPPHMYALAPQNKIINASWTAVWIISLDLYLLLKNLRDKKFFPKILESLHHQEDVKFSQKVQKVKFDDEETFDRYYTEDFKTKMNSVKR